MLLPVTALAVRWNRFSASMERISVLALSSPRTVASFFRECVTVVADENLEIKTRYHGGLRDLIVAERPDLEELADLNRDLRVAMARSRRDQMVYLLEAATRSASSPAQGYRDFRISTGAMPIRRGWWPPMQRKSNCWRGSRCSRRATTATRSGVSYALSCTSGWSRRQNLRR